MELGDELSTILGSNPWVIRDKFGNKAHIYRMYIRDKQKLKLLYILPYFYPLNERRLTTHNNFYGLRKVALRMSKSRNYKFRMFDKQDLNYLIAHCKKFNITLIEVAQVDEKDRIISRIYKYTEPKPPKVPRARRRWRRPMMMYHRPMRMRGNDWIID